MFAMTLPQPGPCTDCGAPATCCYDWGTGMRYGCAAHDPLRPLIAVAVRVPPYYCSLPPFQTQVTAGPGFALYCTCAAGQSTACCPVHPFPSLPVVTC